MLKETKYNIIGDIHGMDVWKSLVKDDCINVFVGDFFDPYTYSIPFEKCADNFKEIIALKKSRPETIILYGNHELHYLYYGEIEERYSRFDENHAMEIQQLLKENDCYFHGVAYSINDQYLVTHAGVSRYWYHQYFGSYEGQSPIEVAAQVNNLWELTYRPFLVRENRSFDLVSEGPTQSPLWIRSWILERYNLFEGTSYIQIVGHTPCAQVKECSGLVFIDCLRQRLKTKPEQTSFLIVQH